MTLNTRQAAVARLVRDRGTPVTLGRVQRITGMIVEAHIPGACIGEMVDVEKDVGAEGGFVAGEVVGFRDTLALIVPLAELRGVSAGAAVHRRGSGATLPVGDALLGRVIDVFARPLDGGPPPILHGEVKVDAGAPSVDKRAKIAERFDTGVRVIDGLLTLGRGQRVGIFAGAGVGKTVLLRQIVAQSAADVVVMGLIGERGCEVHDLLEAGVLSRSVVVAATSDRSPLERARGAQAATAIAEHFCARGKHVLLVIDSLTRYAMALREIGLAAGEPPATKGYPPSVFASLPRLLERVAPLRGGGSITGIYTVLVEGDDLSDPVADSARSLLDGHIVLSREMAARSHFPAVDVLQSTSRVARQVSTPQMQDLQNAARSVLARRREADELRSLGAYVPGQNAAFDEALHSGAKLDEWSRQNSAETSPAKDTVDALARIVGAKRS